MNTFSKLPVFPCAISSLLLVFLLASTAHAGDKYTEEGIKSEVGYLAKELLDLSGKDAYTLESPAYTKPYLGVCTSISEQGIALTCITPGSQADKAGLRTGDIVTEMNGISMRNSDEKKTKHAYFEIVKKMQTGEVIKMLVKRDGEISKISATVGEMKHPAYTLTIKR